MYRAWRKTLNISMRQDHKAGEKLFVDYCDGEGIDIINRDTGEIIPTTYSGGGITKNAVICGCLGSKQLHICGSKLQPGKTGLADESRSLI